MILLRDRLICGVNDSRIQRRLLAKPNLTFEKAIELSMAAESADNDAEDLQSLLQTKCNQ